jgi:excisionase family DNA binding protein
MTTKGKKKGKKTSDKKAAAEKKRKNALAQKRRKERFAEIDPDTLGDVITVDGAAKLLQIDPKTVRELFHRGEIPGGRRLGPKLIRFSRDALLDWLAQGCVSRSGSDS